MSFIYHIDNTTPQQNEAVKAALTQMNVAFQTYDDEIEVPGDVHTDAVLLQRLLDIGTVNDVDVTNWY